MIDDFGNNLRKRSFLIVITLIFVGISIRLFELQVLGSEEYGTKSRNNSIRRIPKVPGRGSMYDRNKQLLVDSRPAFSINITPSNFDENLIPALAKVLDLDSAFVKDKLEKGKKYSIFVPVKIKREIDFKTLSFFEENHEKFPGVEILFESRRTYFDQAKMSHFIGYIKEITEEQITKDTGYYMPGDYIGQKGIEYKYEEVLRGTKGYNYVLVNSFGKKIGKYIDGKMDRPPVDGVDLYLAIDSDLQILAETLLGKRRGAIVVIDPNNGEVLALASEPDYDPNIFSGVTTQEVMDNLMMNVDKPLFDRTVLGEYPPGSTFKMVLATAALQEGIINESWTVNCGGSFTMGDKVFKCTHVHGSVNVTRAIHQSCNIFFYNLMLYMNKKIGWSYWESYCRMFGFGKRTGIDINERPGFIPSESWYNKRYPKGWGRGMLVSLSIGQGEVSVTPVQLACYCATLANGGTYYTPHIVRSYLNKQSMSEINNPIQQRKLPISDEVMKLIRHGMYLAVNVPGGTGAAAQVPGITVAGKTGTAQNPHGQNHAWFIGFAPYDNPKIAVAVLVENGGFGGATSAPIAGALIKQYLLNNKKLKAEELKAKADELLQIKQNKDILD